jgi:DNA-binding transcriptional ArsR family regulator
VTEDQAERAAEILSVVANPMRIRMIQAMAAGELMVAELSIRTGLSQSATSQQLSKLKRAGVLVQRKDKQSRHCTIDPSIAQTLHRLISIAEEQMPLRNQGTRLDPVLGTDHSLDQQSGGMCPHENYGDLGSRQRDEGEPSR